MGGLFASVVGRSWGCGMSVKLGLQLWNLEFSWSKSRDAEIRADLAHSVPVRSPRTKNR